MAVRPHEPNGLPDISVVQAIPKASLDKAAFWLATLGQDWRGDVPYRLHEKGVFGLGSSPPFAPEFIAYVGDLQCNVPGCTECSTQRINMKQTYRVGKHKDSRLRATKAFRKLRRIAPREFDALYLYCIQGYGVGRIARDLTDRSIRLGHEERYNEVSVFLLLYSGIDKIQGFW